MDPRGVGVWDGGSNEAAIWALDYLEAGVEGRVRQYFSFYDTILIAFQLLTFSVTSRQSGRPPPNDDGTANETLHEQMIRLRQLMSSEYTLCMYYVKRTGY